jgi:DNA-binding CsgD family transcriptional regulator
MAKKIILPLDKEEFANRIKTDRGSKNRDFKSIFESKIRECHHFCVGPFFWFIPDNSIPQIAAVSANIELMTPFCESQWLSPLVNCFADMLHPSDKMFVLSSVQLAMQTFEKLPKENQDFVSLNIYGRMLSTQNHYQWSLIQFPGLYFNEFNQVESALVMVTNIAHLNFEPKNVMTILNQSNNVCEYYSIAESSLVKAPLPKISKREHEVLKLMVKGFTGKKIAEQLYISYYTVENHKRNLRVKTNTNTSAELIAWVFDNNLL